jgi:hypothetical protein
MTLLDQSLTGSFPDDCKTRLQNNSIFVPAALKVRLAHGASLLNWRLNLHDQATTHPFRQLRARLVRNNRIG